jgi:hypothetical protein
VKEFTLQVIDGRVRGWLASSPQLRRALGRQNAPRASCAEQRHAGVAAARIGDAELAAVDGAVKAAAPGRGDVSMLTVGSLCLDPEDRLLSAVGGGDSLVACPDDPDNEVC